MTLDLENIKQTCSVIDEEITILQNTLEACFSQGLSYSPMITFYGNDHTRAVTVQPPPQSSFQDTLIRISEVLYIYPALHAHCCIVSIDSIIKDEDGSDLDCLNIFVVSEEEGYFIMLPYSKDSSNNITWRSHQFSSFNILDTDFQGPTKEMINALYMFTHLDSAPYTLNETLSYLSHVGASIVLFDSLKINYYTPQKN